ncbi:MAG: 1-(5-phosphoribosyl)-5-[(5-phosphoribosylamino)methylideneamino]imidazole-4-carboxamide isomerase [Oscillospiraceae bacterium]|nr:1-(5-phosphoribosyl)-5-[(5-phosphoribosylamino)methylideneamino]imidazole-4-carboxamide isomerase [Oscillospiraceae bacterium]
MKEFIVYPAIDIIGGSAVRLSQGDYARKEVYHADPSEVARRWENEGAKFIHVVDLEGAKEGKSFNREAIAKICAAVSVPVQVGGGIRNMETVEDMFNIGVSRVILGTAALANPDFVKETVAKHGDKIAVGIDAKDGKVAVQGWLEVSDTDAIEFARLMAQIGVAHIIYTDIATDGMLQGPNVAAMREMAEAVSLNVIASGGVSCTADVEELRPTGVGGVIVGKALYTGAVTLGDIL